MRPRLLVSLATVAAVAAIVVPSCLPLRDSVKDGPGILGVYVVNGVDTLGTEYSGTVHIRAGGDDGDVVLQWLITGAIQQGRGLVEGDTLTATWETVSGSRTGTTGAATYAIADDGTLRGTRTIDGAEGTATEELFLEP